MQKKKSNAVFSKILKDFNVPKYKVKTDAEKKILNVVV